MIVQSFGSVVALASKGNRWGGNAGALGMYGTASPQTYAKLYRTQPNIRICVDFLARNFAQLGVHAFRRVSDTDRERLAGHEAIRWLSKPNPGKTRYRLFEDWMTDMGVYMNAYWLKVRTPGALGFLRLPPEQVQVEGSLIPTAFIWTTGGQERTFDPSEIVHFNGYDPGNPLGGISPMETLRQLIAELQAAAEYRQSYWTRGARFEGVLEREANSPSGKWGPDKERDFEAQLAQFAAGGSRAGSLPLLPTGLKLKTASSSAKDSEYSASLKLAREVCAAQYHIPQPMVGILDHATFSNVREQHKHLYMDTLGPWGVMFTQELERQVLPEAEDQDGVYLEMNLAEKLKGSFEEQAAALNTLCGAPVMARNEGRARINLPRVDDPAFDTPVTPLNMGTPPPATDEPEPAGMVPTNRPTRVGPADTEDDTENGDEDA